VRRFAAEYGSTEPVLTPAAERALTSRDWRGNVRELRNSVERALLLSDGRTLDERDFLAETPSAGRPGGIPFPATLREVVRGAVEEMVELCGGNKSEAARRLKISRPRLQRLLESAGESGDDTEGPDV
jgi:two-component system response regulator HydG